MRECPHCGVDYFRISDGTAECQACGTEYEPRDLPDDILRCMKDTAEEIPTDDIHIRPESLQHSAVGDELISIKCNPFAGVAYYFLWNLDDETVIEERAKEKISIESEGHGLYVDGKISHLTLDQLVPDRYRRHIHLQTTSHDQFERVKDILSETPSGNEGT